MLNDDDNHHHTSYAAPSSPDPLENGDNISISKRKRRPAGTPDPDAEVVSLSPKTLLESDRYVCEICNQGFQRDQNLQMHRRRHKVPWKLLKRETQEVKKRVFVCPEPTCLHHDPTHALGDLVGIKKHFRRKHSNQKQWVCEKCSKGYAVQSDYKAHLKTCGTRGHSCDCGRVFSRVESFIEHQDTCIVRHIRPELQSLQPVACSSRTASSTSPSSEANFGTVKRTSLPRIDSPMPLDHRQTMFIQQTLHQQHADLELQLLPSSSSDHRNRSLQNSHDNYATDYLKLSIGSSQKNENSRCDPNKKNSTLESTFEVSKLKQVVTEEINLAVMEKKYAEQARREAKRQIEMAEFEFANAKRIRQQAQVELEKAQSLKEQATKKISSTILQITCQACKQQFQTSTVNAMGGPSDETSLAMSYMSSATTTEGEGEGE